MHWHTISKEQALQSTESKLDGLSDSQVEDRQTKYGQNKLVSKKQKPAWLMFLGQFKDFMILILLAAAIVAGMIGDVKDTVVILIIVVLNAVIGFVQEFRAEKAMEALKKMAAPAATALRNGNKKTIDAEGLVPGDIIFLEAGNMVPADMRLLESSSLKVEEASLTGESMSVEKQTEQLQDEQLPLGDRSNMIYKGTLITYGRGKGVVVAIGMQTEIGRIAQMLQEDESLTPLQKRMTDFGKKLSIVVLGICVVIYTTGLLRGEDSLYMLLTAISVAVAAIPEALPAVITIALALGARRMIRKNALIRKLPAVETLGSVTFICTDKTGTLTQNRMAVTEIWTPTSPPNNLQISAEEALLLGMGLNHDVEKNEKGDLVGEPTELALASYALNHSSPHKINAEKYPRVAELPFDSDRKLMTTVHEFDGRFLIITKGALESVLAACEDADEKSLMEEAERMGDRGLRILAYGCRIMDKLPDEIAFATLEKQLQVCGLSGMMDPPREEAKQAIQDCKTAGIVPVMITGDHPVTAEAIARQIGILENPGDKVVTGVALQQMSSQEFEENVERVKVYARVSPQQKLDIVKTLQSRGQFVAMTGDGVNDAPALRKANIGIAMGISGTDVSKEAAHMILLDDNFATIVRAVREGRRIFDNIRKFIKYTMTSNSGEIWVIFLAPLVGLPIPLLPIHILWINLVTDGLPGLALTGEPAEKNLMSLPPRKPRESIFAHGLGLHVLWVGLLMAAVCLGAQAWAIQAGDHKWQTYVFTILCFSQMGHVLAVRSEHYFIFRQGLFSNPSLLLAVLFTFALQFLILYLPLLNDIFSVEALSWKELGACLLLSSIVFHAVEMEKLVRTWRRGKSEKILDKAG